MKSLLLSLRFFFFLLFLLLFCQILYQSYRPDALRYLDEILHTDAAQKVHIPPKNLEAIWSQTKGRQPKIKFSKNPFFCIFSKSYQPILRKLCMRLLIIETFNFATEHFHVAPLPWPSYWIEDFDPQISPSHPACLQTWITQKLQTTVFFGRYHIIEDTFAKKMYEGFFHFLLSFRHFEF